MKRQGRKSAAQTPAPAKERIKGSSVNKSGSASSSKSAKEINFSESIISTLEKKRDEYNAKHPNSKVTLATLKAVFRRGAGAYSSSHRPTITGGAPNSRSAWAFARVNKFLLKKAGNKVKAAYVQDDDLMQRGAILDSSCKTYIDNHESVLKTGYYLNLNEFSSMVDPYGQIPLNLNYTLVTYNSGNQDGLALIDTINPINLQNELAEILNISINQSQVVVGLYIQMAQKLKSISQIEGDSIIVIDRDKVVCKSEKKDEDNIANGGLIFNEYKFLKKDYGFYNDYFGEFHTYNNLENVIGSESNYQIKLNPYKQSGKDAFLYLEGVKRKYIELDFISIDNNNFRGKRLGEILMYLALIDLKEYGIGIVSLYNSSFSDSHRTQDAEKMWRRLMQNEKYQIKKRNNDYYINLSDTTFDADNSDIRYAKGGLINSLKIGMENLKQNGIVLRDKRDTITLIAYNTGNQQRESSLYNKALIYSSVKPIRSANEIIQKFDLQDFETFSEDKIEDYKKNHLIIINQNEVVYDSENPDMRYADGGNIENEFDDLDNNDLVKILKSFYSDLSENELFQYLQLKEGDYTLNVGDNQFVLFRKEPFSKIDALKFGRFVQPYFDASKKPLFARFFDDYKVDGKNIIIKLKDMYADGGKIQMFDEVAITTPKIGKEITCVNCGWHWNTSDSQDFDKYVCHRCGFDNTTFYDSDPMGIYAEGGTFENSANIALPDSYSSIESLKQILNNQGYDIVPLDKSVGKLAKGMTIEQIADKHRVPLSELMIEFENGINTEMEHTDDRLVAESIALDHLYENPKYYSKLQSLNLENGGVMANGGMVVGKSHQEADENGTGEKFIVASTGQVVELEGGEAVIVGKALDSEDMLEFQGEKKTPREIASYLNHAYGGVKFERGGHVECGCTHKKYYHGGELPSAVVDKLNGGEAVITKKTMESKEKYTFEGEKLTPRQILSRINHRYGGVSFARGGEIGSRKFSPEVKLAKMVYFVNNINNG